MVEIFLKMITYIYIKVQQGICHFFLVKNMPNFFLAHTSSVPVTNVRNIPRKYFDISYRETLMFYLTIKPHKIILSLDPEFLIRIPRQNLSQQLKNNPTCLFRGFSIQFSISCNFFRFITTN